MRGLLICALAGFVPVSAAPQIAMRGPDPAAKAIVERFFPASLLQHTRKDQLPPGFEFDVLERFPDGAPKLIVASYTNGEDGAVRVLAGDAAGVFQVADEPSGFAFRGGDSHVWLLEDSDPKQVWVSFEGDYDSSQDWLFLWDGRRLKNLSPTRRGKDGLLHTLLSTAEVLDLYHDGRLSVVSQMGKPHPHLRGEPKSPGRLYTYSHGPYEFDRVLVDWRQEGGQPSPHPAKRVLTLPGAVNRPYELKAVNGDRAGAKRIERGRILLNGVEILSPAQLNRSTEFLSIPVQLKKKNEFEFLLEGERGSRILITLEAVPSASRHR